MRVSQVASGSPDQRLRDVVPGAVTFRFELDWAAACRYALDDRRTVTCLRETQLERWVSKPQVDAGSTRVCRRLSPTSTRMRLLGETVDWSGSSRGSDDHRKRRRRDGFPRWRQRDGQAYP